MRIPGSVSWATGIWCSLSLFLKMYMWISISCVNAFRHLRVTWHELGNQHLSPPTSSFLITLSHLSSHIILSCFRFLNLSDGYRATHKVKEKKIAQHPGMLAKRLIPALNRSQWMGRPDLHSESLMQRRKEGKEAGCHRKETCNYRNIML